MTHQPSNLARLKYDTLAPSPQLMNVRRCVLSEPLHPVHSHCHVHLAKVTMARGKKRKSLLKDEVFQEL